ncbi:hypothetical protein [Actinoplanes couchii]|uniref:hypothetical protein n=1 Tax=Actinoplanes couchii TaxID=403638 RepID=UPI00194508C6|nr:hypothetical protein [Actinoplanes couchii]MDR6323559.1 hypothetical protein [Actinoplanes couchii]
MADGGAGFRVDGEGLRGDSGAVTEFAGRVSAVAGRMPRPNPAPRWATTGAATLAADTARRLLTGLGQDIADTGDRIRAVADDYAEADVRVAGRLRATR